jgi:CoA:oxalate CoA-transferase
VKIRVIRVIRVLFLILSMAKPLTNVKVLDLSRVLAGPFCTMILADLGAEILKVEIPDSGDDSRDFGPFLGGKSLYFLSINRGKESLSLNLKTEEGKAILKDLVQKVDVLVENYKPGTMEKLGLGYETLKELNPELIYAAVSGFGHTGPDSKKPAYDILTQAMGGMMSITGWPDTPPTRVGVSLGDIAAALYAAIGIVAALYQRAVTGAGQKIDVAMLDCQLAILENSLVRCQVTKQAPKPIGNRHPTISPFQAFKAKDTYFILAIGNDGIWKRFCEAVQRPDLFESPDFATNQKRTENIDTLAPLLTDLFQTKTAAEWIEILEQAVVPCSPINDVSEAMRNRQILARNMLVDVIDPEIGTIKVAGNPIKMTSIPEEPTRSPAPDVGEHSEKILTELLQLSQQDIANLKAKGVI